MYFKGIEVINIDEMINKNYKIFAHINEKENESLKNHIDLCLKYFYKTVDERQLDKAFSKIENIFCDNMSQDSISLFREMLINTIALHDIGKTNAYYQKCRLNNNLNIKGIEKNKYSDHSLLSSIIYINEYYKKINCFDDDTKEKLFNGMLLNAYAISRHHGDLKSLDNFKEQFDSNVDSSNGHRLLNEKRILYSNTLNREITITEDDINEIFDYVTKFKNNANKDFSICCYIYERLILSLLYSCDYYSTSEFMNEFETSDFGILNEIDKFYDLYKKSEIYGLIRMYEKEHYIKNENLSNVDDINILRNELFLDAETTLLENIRSDIFYLEAPTGSGKSNTAFNLSFKLLEKDVTKNKIFYVYPFNTLIEQNIKNLKKIFDNDEDILNKIAVINSVEPVKMDKKMAEDEENISLEYYKKALLNRQFLNYPMVLTTHVTLFNYLFGTIKENVFPFHQLANSVIVLDEIQSYKNIIWGEIITFLTAYAKILNIKIIIMSATLPDLDLLSLTEGTTVKLIKDREKYFSNPRFRDRVCVNYTLLNSSNTVDDLYNHIKNKSSERKKIIIEFISKNTAYEFFKMIVNDDEILSDKELMTGDDNIAERERILNKVSKDKSNNGIILVATQVVEAGVDIDMDYGYKDISLFDSEEQFLGRINRSCKNSGEAYFFNLDEAKKIYNGDIRINDNITLKEENIREVLKNKDFYNFYNVVIDRLKAYTNKLNKYNIEDFYKDKVNSLNFIDIQNHMKLIDNDYNKISIYLSSLLEINDEKLDGIEIWDNYRKLLENMEMDYAKKRIKLSQLRSKMNNFIYEIRWKCDFTYNDRIGDLYYIENGDKYFTNGKLDKEKFKKWIGDFI